MKAMYVLKAILRIVQSYPLAALPSDGWREKHWLPFSPLSLDAHTHADPLRSPAPHSLWAGVRRLRPGARGPPGSQLLTLGGARISALETEIAPRDRSVSLIINKKL